MKVLCESTNPRQNIMKLMSMWRADMFQLPRHVNGIIQASFSLINAEMNVYAREQSVKQ